MSSPAAAPLPATLDEAFRIHHKTVFQAAYRITGNPVDAEDVLQTVFLRLATRGEPLDLAPNPRAYLHRAAVNAALDVVRGRGVSRSVSISEFETDSLGRSVEDPEAEHHRREMQALLRRAAAQLGRTAAEIFSLRYFEGYDNEEIAAELGMNKLVIAVLLNRAKARVKKEIGVYLEAKQ